MGSMRLRIGLRNILVGVVDRQKPRSIRPDPPRVKASFIFKPLAECLLRIAPSAASKESRTARSR